MTHFAHVRGTINPADILTKSLGAKLQSYALKFLRYPNVSDQRFRGSVNTNIRYRLGQ